MTQSQFMMGWQIGSYSLSDNVAHALQKYIDKYGQPPSILIEHNPLVSFQDVPLPVGMNIVLRAERVVLPSMLLIGATNESSQMGMVVEEESVTLDMERKMNEEVQESPTMQEDGQG